MAMAIEFLYLFYFFVSAVVLIVMSALASIALRSKTQVSTHTQLKCVGVKRQCDLLLFSSQQAIVLMTTVPIEMPVE